MDILFLLWLWLWFPPVMVVVWIHGAPDRFGLQWRWGSAWVGSHWSPLNLRLCVNLVPFVTLWLCWPGGFGPKDQIGLDKLEAQIAKARAMVEVKGVIP